MDRSKLTCYLLHFLLFFSWKHICKDFFVKLLVSFFLFIFTVDLPEMVTGHDLVIVMAIAVDQEAHLVNLVVRKVEHLLITSRASG